ncbi:MAG: choice-of-anchor D domain-containing protein [Myxococcaceae bacterium]|nr:choice-of-anchor D domain-containing protein [Myxococcaceae bacterium]
MRRGLGRLGGLGVVLAVGFLGCRNDTVGQVRPQLQPPPSPVEFGTVPVLNEKVVDVEVTNLGRAKLSVSDVALAKDDGIFRIATAPTTVEGGETGLIQLAFRPTAERPYETSLSFKSDDAENPSVTLVVTGTGSTRARLALEPAMLDFGRVGECATAVQQLTVKSTGTADLVVTELGFTEGTPAGFSFVGSTRTPATVRTVDPRTGLMGQLQLTVRYAAPPGATGDVTGGLRLKTTDPDAQELVVPLRATINRAPVASIADLGNGAPGLSVTLDGTASSDPDGDAPLGFRWTLRNRPLASTTAIAMPQNALTAMRLDPSVPGVYEVQLEVTDAQGVKSCQPARKTIVASPAQKLLVELFWDNLGTDLDLHFLGSPSTRVGSVPGSVFYQNRKPDWGVVGDPADDPELSRDALTGYGPEVFGWVNPIDGSYRIAVVFEQDFGLGTMQRQSRATVRVYQFGILKAELSRTLTERNEVWLVADVVWPSGDVTAVP